MGNLYERTDIYDLFDSEKKYNVVRKHWETLLKGKNIRSFLDISYGTGSLTLPLAELGVSLFGSDLSEEMLKRGREKAEEKGLGVDLRQCDFRELTDHFKEKFDCVGSTGNSLPYVSNNEVFNVLEQMDTLIESGGWLYYDMRNWDKILQERKRFYLYEPVILDDVRVNTIQVWDYHADDSMTFNLLYTFEKENKFFRKEQFEEHYIPIKREVILNKLVEMQYQDISIMCHPACFENIEAEAADWYCVMARKS